MSTARYDGLAGEWDTSAAAVYGPLARRLVEASPVPLAGRRVADVGTGTGAAADVAVAAGARVIGLDRSIGMLAHRRGERPPAVCADVLALPLADGCVDVVVAAFLLNHLSPGPALAQIPPGAEPGRGRAGVHLGWRDGPRQGRGDRRRPGLGLGRAGLVPGDEGPGGAGDRKPEGA